MVTKPVTLQALPVAVHTASHARQSGDELARFEEIVDAADAAVASSMHARRVASATVTERPEGEAAEALHAVLTAVAAITNAETVPTPTDSKRELIRWTLTTLQTWREQRCERRLPAASGMDHGACMELVARLNLAMGGAPSV